MIAYERGSLTWRKSSYSAPNGECVEVGWRKSSYSAGNGECVEVGWRKSSCSGNGADCIEVAPGPVGVAVRDSKLTTCPTLAFDRSPWRAFLASLT